MAIQLSGSDLVYTSPYAPEDGSLLDHSPVSQATLYLSANCAGTAYVDSADYSPQRILPRLEISGSGKLVKRTSQIGGFSNLTANSYYGNYDGTLQCVNNSQRTIYPRYYETVQTSLLMSTYQQSHTLRWSN